MAKQDGFIKRYKHDRFQALIMDAVKSIAGSDFKGADYDKIYIGEGFIYILEAVDLAENKKYPELVEMVQDLMPYKPCFCDFISYETLIHG